MFLFKAVYGSEDNIVLMFVFVLFQCGLFLLASHLFSSIGYGCIVWLAG